MSVSIEIEGFPWKVGFIFLESSGKTIEPLTRWWFQRFFIFTRLGKWSNLTNIFEMGWNHQLVKVGVIWIKCVLQIYSDGSWVRCSSIRWWFASKISSGFLIFSIGHLIGHPYEPSPFFQWNSMEKYGKITPIFMNHPVWSCLLTNMLLNSITVLDFSGSASIPSYAQCISIFIYISSQTYPNVGKYAIHWASGIVFFVVPFPSDSFDSYESTDLQNHRRRRLRSYLASGSCGRWMLGVGGWSMGLNQGVLEKKIHRSVETESLCYSIGGGFMFFVIFTRSLGEWSNLTNIFETGWNHHPSTSRKVECAFPVSIQRLKYPKQSWLITKCLRFISNITLFHISIHFLWCL